MKTETEKHYQEITICVPIEEPHPAILRKIGNFRLGQLHRKNGLPCMNANGAYLDGWYEPDKVVPPWITQAQKEAFNL